MIYVILVFYDNVRDTVSKTNGRDQFIRYPLVHCEYCVASSGAKIDNNFANYSFMTNA